MKHLLLPRVERVLKSLRYKRGQKVLMLVPSEVQDLRKIIADYIRDNNLHYETEDPNLHPSEYAKIAVSSSLEVEEREWERTHPSQGVSPLGSGGAVDEQKVRSNPSVNSLVRRSRNRKRNVRSRKKVA